MMSDRANIVEIFSSIQGEGLLIGSRQLFIRFSPCNLSCNYCDTSNYKLEKNVCQVERTPGKGDFYTVPNPIDKVTLDGIITSLRGFKGLHHSISLTGGEPLLQADFLQSWLPAVKKKFLIYLETNGTLFENFKKVMKFIDIVSMDIKLPGTANIEEQWENHYWFIKAAMTKRLFIKIVVSEDTTPGEFAKAVQMISSLNRKIPLIIQPVTPLAGSGGAPNPVQLLAFHREAAGSLHQVRVIPQTHKIIGIL